jgi:hypothetical protein
VETTSRPRQALRGSSGSQETDRNRERVQRGSCADSERESGTTDCGEAVRRDVYEAEQGESTSRTEHREPVCSRVAELRSKGPACLEWLIRVVVRDRHVVRALRESKSRINRLYGRDRPCAGTGSISCCLRPTSVSGPSL